MLLKDGSKQADKDLLERQLARVEPSQLPCAVVKQRYEYILRHAKNFNDGKDTIFACGKTGSEIKGTIIKMNVYNDDNTLNCAGVPVVHMFCSSCDPKPDIYSGMSIYARELQTVFL